MYIFTLNPIITSLTQLSIALGNGHVHIYPKPYSVSLSLSDLQRNLHQQQQSLALAIRCIICCCFGKCFTFNGNNVGRRRSERRGERECMCVLLFTSYLQQQCTSTLSCQWRPGLEHSWNAESGPSTL